MNASQCNSASDYYYLLLQFLSLIGVQKQWIPHERLPRCGIKQMLARYLDITTPPRPNVLQYLARCTENEEDKERLDTLAKVSEMNENENPCFFRIFEQIHECLYNANILISLFWVSFIKAEQTGQYNVLRSGTEYYPDEKIIH